MTQEEALAILKSGKNVFLTGPAGSGKTYLLNQYINFLKEHRVNIAVTASTGIAATHIKGVTIHSWSGIGIKDSLSDWDLDAIEQKEYLWKRYEKTNVLIIDEISMLSSSILDSIDKIARMFKMSDSPFGGMQVIFCGDFFQLPPIQKRDLNAIEFEEKTIFAFNSDAWMKSDLHICYLSEQFRQKDSELENILNSIRKRDFNQDLQNKLTERIIDETEEEITRLYTHNFNVDTYNNRKLAEIDAPVHKYKMEEKGKENLIGNLKKGCLVPEVLEIKKDALVMFVKNNTTVGYINGTTGKVIDFEDGFPVVETKDGETFTALPQEWSIEEGDKVLAQIKQVPLKLAWAVTIHKSQGMTLDNALIDLSKSFVEGQGYVALSRLRDLKGLKLVGFNQKALEVHPEVLERDEEFKEISDELFDKYKNIDQQEFEKEHKQFMKKIGAKKFKVLNSSGNKLSTYQITKNFIDDNFSISEIASKRDIKEGTVISHIQRLLEEKSLKEKDILYLKPSTDEFKKMIEEIRDVVEKQEDIKLTPIFKSLNKKYSFEEIRFALLFI
jgi:ATP-dependent exoDNAse (exonuclease V) alpha subunit/predicted DNA-binding protein YlxM (UPF0122 family)